jgi:putative glycosyltransferase (TIGR04372 family)
MATSGLQPFLNRQLAHIRSEGIYVLGRKMGHALNLLFSNFIVLLALPLAIVIRLLYPISKLRLGYFYSDRIGHFAFDVEYYLVSSELLQDKRQARDIFFFEGAICNQALASLAARQIKVIPWSWPIYRASALLPNNPVVLRPARKLNGSRDPQGIFTKTESRLLSKKWVAAGWSQERPSVLGQYGVDERSKIVCLIVRDPAYLNSKDKNRNWDYHSYRDTPLSLYEAVAVDLAEKGYFVFRMGKTVEQALTVDHERIIDYANMEWRNDFLDLWLISRSSFCISTSTGLDSVADICRKPIALINYLPLAYFQTWSNSVLAPCNLIWRATGKKLTCQEHLIYSFQRSQDYANNGIDVQPLNEKQISKVVLELEQRLSKSWRVSENELQRQRRFREIFCLNDSELIERWFRGEGAPKSEILANRSRPREVIRKFHSEAFLSEAFLEDNSNFLDPG